MWMKMRMKTKMGREKGNYENKVIIFVINYLLTESEIFTVKYQTQVWYFTVKTKRSRLISSLIYGTFYYENQYNRN